VEKYGAAQAAGPVEFAPLKVAPLTGSVPPCGTLAPAFMKSVASGALASSPAVGKRQPWVD
jgi:hypothetical protein